MHIIVTGLNHNSAPIDIREKLAFSVTDTNKALSQLKYKFPDTEFVLLSTCNRVELYSVISSLADAGGFDGEELAKFMSEFHDLGIENSRKFFYIRQGSDAVRHLLRVVSSLDSMVVGESQIIAQVKESYSLACGAKTTGKILNRLFHCGFSTSKKVHATTSISSGRVSVAGVAVELAMQLFADTSSAKILVVGAGEMGKLLIKHLLHIGCKNIVVVNRSYEHAQDTAERYGVRAIRWEELHKQFIITNVVIASAAVQDYLFEKNSFTEILRNRRAGTLLIIDIAVPRNFEPSINELKDVYLYGIDDLSNVVEQNRKAREKDMIEGMQIIEESVTDFMDWFRARDIGPLIGRMRAEFERISQKELNSFFVGVRSEASCRQAAESMVKRIVNRLLHCVINNVDAVVQEHGPAEAAKLIDSIVRQAEEISARPDSNKEISL